MQEVVTDPLIKAKFKFPGMVVGHLKTFLKGYPNLPSYGFSFNHWYCLYLPHSFNIIREKISVKRCYKFS